MTFTLKHDINMDSLVIQHQVLLQAMDLLMGREGVLETEKELYLILSIVDNMIEENLIQLCNDDGRDLDVIMMVEIEPFFNTLIDKQISSTTYNKLKQQLLNRCKEIWDNQHSVMGVLDALLTTIATMAPEDKKEVLENTAKIAEKAFEQRTEVMVAKADQTNSKLEQLVEQYQRQGQNLEKSKDNKVESNE